MTTPASRCLVAEGIDTETSPHYEHLTAKPPYYVCVCVCVLLKYWSCSYTIEALLQFVYQEILMVSVLGWVGGFGCS